MIFSKKRKKVSLEKQIIGCLGVGRAVGTTSFTIALANYLANGCGQRVAVIECNTHNDYLQLRKCIENTETSLTEFKLCGIHFFRKVSNSQIAEILAMDYDAILLDMQYKDAEWKLWMTQCNKKIVLLGLQPWKNQATEHFLQTQPWKNQKIIYLSMAVFPQFQRWIHKNYRIQIVEIPIERDVFRIQSQNLSWYHNITR